MRFKKGSIVKVWMDLRESNAPSDFPNVMADVQHKVLLDAYRGWPSPWRQYCRVGMVDDFKAHHRKWLSEFQDLLEKQPGGPYQSGSMKDYGYSITLGTFGRTFSLLRETVVNDDLDAFRTTPTKMGRAAARTIAKKVAAVLESNPNAYDGSSLIRAGNSASTALTADTTGITALQTGMRVIRTSTDPHTGEILGLRPRFLLVSPTLEETAKWLMNSTEVRGGSSSSLTSNPVKGQLEVVVDPFLTVFPSRWYILADPADAHAIEVVMLEGEEEPALLMQPPAMRIGGGDDQWGYAYDDIEYKARHDWGISPAYYQAIYKGGS